MTALVGLDVGTSGVKAVAVKPDGTVIARAEERYRTISSRPGWSEQDPTSWTMAAERTLARLHVEPTAIGVTGQMHGLVALDARGKPVRPAILWNDQRTAAECAEIEQRIGRVRLLSLTGNRALPGFTAPKLLWLRRHEPEAYEQIARIALPKDYIRLHLGGEWTTDVSDASGTLLLDVRARNWSADVVEALELDPAWLPAVLESAEAAGSADGVTLAAGAGDQAAGALGAGIDRPGPVSVVLGTSGVVFALLPELAPEPDGRLHRFCAAVPATWFAMGVMLAAAGSLAWLQAVLGASVEQLLADAAQVPPGADGVLFAPYLSGERTPHVDPDVRGAYTGLSLNHDRGSLVRALLEGVSYGLRDSLELLRACGQVPEVGRLSGGGSDSRLWAEILASVLEMPLERTSAATDGAAMGAALLAGVADGTFADIGEAVATSVRVVETIEPKPQWVGAYQEGYERYRLLYPMLTPHAVDPADTGGY